MRFSEMYPGRFRNLHLYAPDLCDLILFIMEIGLCLTI